MESRRVKITKTMIKDAMLELLNEKPLTKITVRELCLRADVNRATFYKYYDNPYALMDEMNHDFLSEIDKYVGEISEGNGGMIPLLKYVEENCKMCKILVDNYVENNFVEAVVRQPEVARQISASFSGNTDNPYLQDFVIYGTCSVILKWIRNDCPESAEEFGKYLASFS